MVQLLIVDDHPDQVESMARTIPWRTYGVQAVHKAYSAAEALGCLQAVPIDILITDIRMPGMDGLELIHAVREQSEKTKCVLMSGYSDFEYAMQAIQYRTSGYLMKPVDTEELTRLIQQILRELQKEYSVKDALYTLRENIPFLRGRLLTDLLHGRSLPRDRLGRKLEGLQLDFTVEDEVCLMLVRLDEEAEPEQLSLLEYAVTNMAEEVFGPSFALWHGKDGSGQLAFLAKRRQGSPDAGAEETERGDSPRMRTNAGAGPGRLPLPAPGTQREGGQAASDSAISRLQLERCVDELQKKTRIYLKRKIAVALVDRWTRLAEQAEVAQLHQLASAAIRKRGDGEKQFFVVVTGQAEDARMESLKSLYEPPLLLHLMETGRWDMAGERLGIILGELQMKWRDAPEYLSETFFAIAGAFLRISHKNGHPLQQLLGEDGRALRESRPFYAFEPLQAWMQRVFRQMEETLGRSALETELTVVERIQAYIQAHMDGDASLQAIADHVGLHPAYVSKVYKVETGICLSDYVVKVKMERAAQLLREKNAKIYTIAGQLGYQTTHYFIKVFKKYYGVTPQEFKLRQ